MALNVESLVCFSYPLRKGPSGYFALDLGQDAVEGIIEQILNTAPGERVMRPTFGCDVHQHLFAPADDTDAGLIKSDIAEALRLWAPWLVVQGSAKGVDVTVSGHLIEYMIRYRLAGGPLQNASGEIQLRKRG